MRTMFRGVFGNWVGAAFADFAVAFADAKAWNKNAEVIAVRMPLWENDSVST